MLELLLRWPEEAFSNSFPMQEESLTYLATIQNNPRGPRGYTQKIEQVLIQRCLKRPH